MVVSIRPLQPAMAWKKNSSRVKPWRYEFLTKPCTSGLKLSLVKWGSVLCWNPKGIQHLSTLKHCECSTNVNWHGGAYLSCVSEGKSHSSPSINWCGSMSLWGECGICVQVLEVQGEGLCTLFVFAATFKPEWCGRWCCYVQHWHEIRLWDISWEGMYEEVISIRERKHGEQTIRKSVEKRCLKLALKVTRFKWLGKRWVKRWEKKCSTNNVWKSCSNLSLKSDKD